jgi:hypothetical protein
VRPLAQQLTCMGGPMWPPAGPTALCCSAGRWPASSATAAHASHEV